MVLQRTSDRDLSDSYRGHPVAIRLLRDVILVHDRDRNLQTHSSSYCMDTSMGIRVFNIACRIAWIPAPSPPSRIRPPRKIVWYLLSHNHNKHHHTGKIVWCISRRTFPGRRGLLEGLLEVAVKIRRSLTIPDWSSTSYMFPISNVTVSSPPFHL